jgi:hypothetical protein
MIFLMTILIHGLRNDKRPPDDPFPSDHCSLTRHRPIYSTYDVRHCRHAKCPCVHNDFLGSKHLLEEDHEATRSRPFKSAIPIHTCGFYRYTSLLAAYGCVMCLYNGFSVQCTTPTCYRIIALIDRNNSAHSCPGTCSIHIVTRTESYAQLL